VDAYEQYEMHRRMLLVLRKVLISLQKSGRGYFESREISKEIDLLYKSIFDVEKYVKRELTEKEKGEIDAIRRASGASPQDKQDALSLT
jgi:hypothetical protein